MPEQVVVPCRRRHHTSHCQQAPEPSLTTNIAESSVILLIQLSWLTSMAGNSAPSSTVERVNRACRLLWLSVSERAWLAVERVAWQRYWA